ncbi:hypothetical protein IVB40_07555 [Bradyrhizobium sp. 40]|uniref:helix-turn-helix domain-containing protein n=1 Tax=Bradyrhizobium sp. 40 TaxID=2782674 RepID=UPI001FFE9492|nr:hypothetical protein [Bradyrhizobium sp. 40]UPJ43916.1 hypothetical protein IVB40_07555 [Bradyrhizobium sp. 40]
MTSYLAPAPAPRQLDIIADTALNLTFAPRSTNRSGSSTKALNSNRSGSSTVSSKPNHSGSSTIAAIDRRRKAAGVSHEKLCRAADVHLGNWFCLLRGQHAPKQATIDKLNDALDALASGEAPAQKLSLCQAYLRSVTVQLAIQRGWDPELMLSQDFTSENTNDPVWLQASRLRRCAVYLLVEGLQFGKANIGRAIGVSRQAVHKSVAAIEAERDKDAGFDVLMSSMMLQVKGKRL